MIVKIEYSAGRANSPESVKFTAEFLHLADDAVHGGDIALIADALAGADRSALYIDGRQILPTR